MHSCHFPNRCSELSNSLSKVELVLTIWPSGPNGKLAYHPDHLLTLSPLSPAPPPFLPRPPSRFWSNFLSLLARFWHAVICPHIPFSPSLEVVFERAAAAASAASPVTLCFRCLWIERDTRTVCAFIPGTGLFTLALHPAGLCSSAGYVPVQSCTDTHSSAETCDSAPAEHTPLNDTLTVGVRTVIVTVIRLINKSMSPLHHEKNKSIQYISFSQ